jgi:hypothetical protein
MKTNDAVVPAQWRWQLVRLGTSSVALNMWGTCTPSLHLIIELEFLPSGAREQRRTSSSTPRDLHVRKAAVIAVEEAQRPRRRCLVQQRVLVRAVLLAQRALLRPRARHDVVHCTRHTHGVSASSGRGTHECYGTTRSYWTWFTGKEGRFRLPSSLSLSLSERERPRAAPNGALRLCVRARRCKQVRDFRRKSG